MAEAKAKTPVEAIAKVAELKRDDVAIKKSFSHWADVWANRPEKYRTHSAAEFMALNGHPKFLVCEIGNGDMGRDKESLGSNFIGIDWSFAAQRKAQRIHRKANFIVASATAIPLRDDKVEFAMSVNTVFNFGTDLYQGIKEMARITKAYILFNVMSLSAINLKRKDKEFIDADHAVFATPIIKGKPDYSETLSFMDTEGAGNLMEELGFKSVQLNHYLSPDGVPMIWVDACKHERE